MDCLLSDQVSSSSARISIETTVNPELLMESSEEFFATHRNTFVKCTNGVHCLTCDHLLKRKSPCYLRAHLTTFCHNFFEKFPAVERGNLSKPELLKLKNYCDRYRFLARNGHTLQCTLCGEIFALQTLGLIAKHHKMHSNISNDD